MYFLIKASSHSSLQFFISTFVAIDVFVDEDRFERGVTKDNPGCKKTIDNSYENLDCGGMSNCYPE
jgi:hypothetical protein